MIREARVHRLFGHHGARPRGSLGFIHRCVALTTNSEASATHLLYLVDALIFKSYIVSIAFQRGSA